METFINKKKTLISDISKTDFTGESVCIMAESFSLLGIARLLDQIEKADSVKIFISNPTVSAYFDGEFDISAEDRFFQTESIKRISSLFSSSKVQIKKNETIAYGLIAVGKNWYMLSSKNITAKTFGFSEDSTDMLPISKFLEEENSFFKNEFETLWTDSKKTTDIKIEFLDKLNELIALSPEKFYFHVLKNLFEKESENDKDPELTSDFKDSRIWNLMFQFQKDAVCEILKRLDSLGVCILADSVGLGKTFTALGVIKAYLSNRKRVLVLCPKKLENNWKIFTELDKKDNILRDDNLNYSVHFHTDMNRESEELDRIDWGNFDLVVIDESHNFRTGFSEKKDFNGNRKENRYSFLVNKVINEGRETKLLLLSATPVNNRFTDLKNQLQLAYDGRKIDFSKNLGINDIDGLFKGVEAAFTKWSKQNNGSSVDELLEWLNPDFIPMLEKVSIARSREHIKKFYSINDIGSFPTRNQPIDINKYENDKLDYVTLAFGLGNLNLSVYTPSVFIKEECKSKYPDLFISPKTGKTLSQYGREKGIVKLMGANLLKRLESSVYSFKKTVDNICNQIDKRLALIEEYERGKINVKASSYEVDSTADEIEDELEISVIATNEVKIDLADMNCERWKENLHQDLYLFGLIKEFVSEITAETDSKLQTLKAEILKKINNPINDGNKKILIFTAFSNTADYLYENINEWARKNFNLNTGLVTGGECKSTLDKVGKDFNKILMYFSPKSKHRELICPGETEDIDILIATDCISEGQNLQDCDWLINYDIHWNPVRVVQRFGRIDRIGSSNSVIQLENFWPDVDLDVYINLHNRIMAKMTLLVMNSTGDENILTNEKSRADIRAKQITEIKNEPKTEADLIIMKQFEELRANNMDIQSRFSITDIGVSGFKSEYKSLIKNKIIEEDLPPGLCCCIKSPDNSIPKGFIFCFKEKEHGKDEDKKRKKINNLYPYNLIYVDSNGHKVLPNSMKVLSFLHELCQTEETITVENKVENKVLLDKACSLLNKKSDEDAINSLFSGVLLDTSATKQLKASLFAILQIV
ncbi:MAG: helicase-related protein [Treponema sp.]|nr:helicase-related protein [Treponema sp.]